MSSIPPELTESDLCKLDAFRVSRYRSSFPELLKGCSIFLSGLDHTLLIICPKEQVQTIEQNRVNLQLQAWYLCGAVQVSLHCEQNLLWKLPTRPAFSYNHVETKSSSKGKGMATATQERASNLSKTYKTLSTDIPILKDIAPVAERANQPADAIAHRIRELGESAGYDPESNTFKATDKGLQMWADYWAKEQTEAILAQQKAILLGVGEDNGIVSETTLEAPKEQKAKTRRTRRFKDFGKSNAYSKTIGNFLEAQKYDAAQRVELIEQIGQLGEEANSADGSLAERALTKILSKYPASGRAVARKGLIGAAHEMQGKILEDQTV